jgi:hypothetical protein
MPLAIFLFFKSPIRHYSVFPGPTIRTFTKGFALQQELRSDLAERIERNLRKRLTATNATLGRPVFRLWRTSVDSCLEVFEYKKMTFGESRCHL